ncbi:MAG: transposase [Bacilli bacterium]
MFHKGDHKVVFTYNANVACDINNYILDFELGNGSEHDSTIVNPLYRRLVSNYKDIVHIGLDAGYKIPIIMKMILDNNQVPITPYKRPMTKRGFFKKYDFVYDEFDDDVICPENKILKYSTTDREGYRIYKSRAKDCKSCPSKYKCTESENDVKVYTRHVWQDYMDQAEDIRHTIGSKDLYRKRSQTIERVFADGKELHGLRYTKKRGKKRVKDELLLIFACMNLKKMAIRA